MEKRENVLTLPKSVLMNRDMLNHTAGLFVLDSNSRAIRKPVETGLSHEDVIEITMGLAETDRVVARGGFNLKDGDPVQIVNRDRPGQPDGQKRTEAGN